MHKLSLVHASRCGAVGLAALLLVGAGCSSTTTTGGAVDSPATVNSGEGAPPGSIHNLPIPAGVSAARAALAAKLGVKESSITILTAFEKNWPDSCLGLGGKDEMCAQVITPGYEVTMNVSGSDTEYVYRTDNDGKTVRQEK